MGTISEPKLSPRIERIMIDLELINTSTTLLFLLLEKNDITGIQTTTEKKNLIINYFLSSLNHDNLLIQELSLFSLPVIHLSSRSENGLSFDILKSIKQRVRTSENYELEIVKLLFMRLSDTY